MTVSKTFEVFVPVKPVPASRPRVSKWGTYFTKTYVDFRNEMYLFLTKLKKQHPPCSAQFEVEIEFICRKPKTPANEYPVGDVDNFLKGPLDAITKVGMFWKDDVQVVRLVGSKRYQNKDEPYGMKIKITEL